MYQKTNFLYILTEYLPEAGGGIISHYGRLLPGLVKDGHNVTVLLASRGKLGHPEYEIEGVRVEPLKAKFLDQYSNRFKRWASVDIFYFWLPVAWAAWAQAQEELDFDLVEATDFGLLFLPWVVGKKRSPIVVSMHGSFGQVDWFSHSNPRSLAGDLIRILEATSARAADVIHANSRANAKFWSLQLQREIRVIPPACENVLNDERCFSRKYQKTLKGLVVGRLESWKGPAVLCEALRLAPEIDIEWVGGDTEWSSTGLKASEYLAGNFPDVFSKRLRWLGRLDREQVAEKMQAAGFLVVPSLWDVFNLTVAEGMEAGLPVICSRAAGAEMLIEHGHSGFLFDPAKPEELARCLKKVFEMGNSERLEIGRRAQEAVKTHLNEAKILNLLEESYFEVIKKGATIHIDAWLESLLSPEQDLQFPQKINIARRAIRKVGRILADV